MPTTFDAAELMDRADNDQEFLRETVEMLTSDGPQLLAEIERAATDGNAAGVAAAAHGLKGMISNFCSPDTQAAALAVEQLGRAGDLAPLPPAMAALKARLGALIAELNDFVAGRA